MVILPVPVFNLFKNKDAWKGLKMLDNIINKYFSVML